MIKARFYGMLGKRFWRACQVSTVSMEVETRMPTVAVFVIIALTQPIVSLINCIKVETAKKMPNLLATFW